MLRASIRSRAFNGVLAARSAPQWLAAQRAAQVLDQHRFYADLKKPGEVSSVGVPTAAIDPPVDPAVVEPDNIPRPPPTPQEVGALAASTSPTPPVAAPPPSSKPKPKRKFRTTLLYLLVLSALGYGGGVYYSLINDNFHDFFTEYIPFAEDAVGYLEEREFKKRFPLTSVPSKLREQIRGEHKVTVGARSGVLAQKAQAEASSDLGSNGRHMSAVDDHKPQPQPIAAPQKDEPLLKAKESKPEPAIAVEKKEAVPPKPIETSAPPAPGPIKAIDNINIELATEPVMQDVVKILNDIITVINADGAQKKYADSIDTAKGNLSKVINDLAILKSSEQKAADDKIKGLHTEFDNMAKELIRRQEESIQNQEMRWKEEYEAERAKLQDAYDGKLKSEIEEAGKVYDAKLKNQLLEQSIALRREFGDQVRSQVESEREGRLSRLSELSSSVQDLEKLTGDWNAVVDTTLKTQHLIVAVEAVRAKLETAEKPSPFTEELAALKEVADDDAVVNAAIASINPAAYQRGIPTSSQLIDRFRRVASEVRKASLLPENAGLASHVASLALSKVMFRKSGIPVGDDVESVLARTEVLLEEGHLDHAAREMNGLTGWAKTLSRDWLGDVRRVLEVQQALDVIATEARLQSLLVD